jgi:hypothetical protein
MGKARQEMSAPMLEAHAPQEALHTWKGFFIHIATIVIGLFIAVGLEQTVEFFSPPTSEGTTGTANAGSLRRRPAIRRR